LGLGGSEKNKEQQTTPLFRKNQYKEVISQYQQAAYQGIAEDQTQLGLCYKNGWGVSKDPVQAVYWLRKAADHGHALAQVHLGTCYKDGIGVPENIHQAIFWYKKAADQDNAEAKKLLKQLKVTFP